MALFGSGPRSNILQTVAPMYQGIIDAEKQKGLAMREAMGAFGKALDPKTMAMRKFKQEFSNLTPEQMKSPNTLFRMSAFLAENGQMDAALGMQQRGMELAKMAASPDAPESRVRWDEQRKANIIEEFKEGEWVFSAVAKQQQDEMSVHLQKRLSEANDRANLAATNVQRYNDLATKFDNIEMSSGWLGIGAETWKDVAGTQDEVTALKRRYYSVKGSEAVKNLPPGAASDADIALALKGFPADTANSETIASFMRGLAKLEEATNKYETFKANFISENRSESGMLKAWREQSDTVLKVELDENGNLVFVED